MGEVSCDSKAISLLMRSIGINPSRHDKVEIHAAGENLDDPISRFVFEYQVDMSDPTGYWILKTTGK